MPNSRHRLPILASGKHTCMLNPGDEHVRRDSGAGITPKGSEGLRRDLTLMGRDIDDGLFACFLRISMPPTWNYVFAGLPNNYTSAEVERQVKDEYGIKTNQETVAMAY